MVNMTWVLGIVVSPFDAILKRDGNHTIAIVSSIILLIRCFSLLDSWANADLIHGARAKP